MTVAKLIQKLKKLDGRLPVHMSIGIRGYRVESLREVDMGTMEPDGTISDIDDPGITHKKKWRVVLLRP